MSHDLYRGVILNAVQAALAAESISYPVEWPNRDLERDTAGPWLRVTLTPGETVPQSLGVAEQRMERTPVILVVQCFLSLDRGTSDAYELADALARQMDYQVHRAIDLVNDRRVDIHCRTWAIRDIGLRDGLHQFNLTLQCTVNHTNI